MFSVSNRKSAILILFLLATLATWSFLAVITVLCHIDHRLYFENDRLDAIMFLFGLCATWLCATLQFTLWPRTVYFSFISIPICLLATICAILGSFDCLDTISSGVNLSREKIASSDLSSLHRVNCYRLNGGATTDYAVVACDEWIVLGLKWSHALCYQYHCSEADVQQLEHRRVRVVLHSTPPDVHIFQF